MTLIIGLAAPAPQCGKSTVAAMLLDMADDGIELPFAGPLKSMVRRFLDAACISDAQCDLYESRAKELVIPEIGVSYRHLCQTLGTEWGRACISPDIWIKVWKESVDNAANDGCDVIAVPTCAMPTRPRPSERLVGRSGGSAAMRLWLQHRQRPWSTPARVN